MKSSNEQRQPSDETILLWLDLEADGELSSAEASRLEMALGERPELRGERLELQRLHADLGTRIEVRQGFSESVMNALPAAAWEPTGRQAWGVAIAIAALLAVASGVMMSLTGASTTAPGLGVLAAIGELLKASALTGAGLLGASWRGLGLALQQLLDASPLTMVVFALGVVALNLLFVRLLRRRSSVARVAVRGSSEGGDRPSGPSA